MNYTYLKQTLYTATCSFVFLSMVGIAPVQAATTSDMQAQIQSLLQQIIHLKELDVIQSGKPTGACSLLLSRNLSLGSTGSDVLALQKFLNRDEETKVALYNYGSPGYETTYYGVRTKEAIEKFQNKYRSAQVMVNGIVDSGTRVQLAALCKNINGETTTPVQTTNSASASRSSEHDSAIALGDTGIVYGVSVSANNMKQTVESITFHFSEDPAHYVDSLTLYRDNNQVKNVSASAATEVGNEYRLTITNIDEVMNSNTTDTFTLKAHVKNSLSSTYRDDSIAVYVPRNGITVRNTNNTRTTIPNNDLESRSFDISGSSNSNTNADDGELKAKETTDSPDDTDVTVSKNNATNNVTIIEAEIEAQNSDVTLNDVFVTIDSDNNDARDIVRSLQVRKGSATIDTKDVVQNGNSAITVIDSNGDRQTLVAADEYYVRFTNLSSVKIDQDDTVTLTIRADFEKQSNGTYDDNTDVTFTLHAIEGRDQRNNRVVTNNLSIGNSSTFTLQVN
jgi:hypothetical protein